VVEPAVLNDFSHFAEHDFVGGVQSVQKFLGLQTIVAALCLFLYIPQHFVDLGPEKTVEVLGF
jgi:hypothetical protein